MLIFPAFRHLLHASLSMKEATPFARDKTRMVAEIISQSENEILYSCTITNVIIDLPARREHPHTNTAP